MCLRQVRPNSNAASTASSSGVAGSPAVACSFSSTTPRRTIAIFSSRFNKVTGQTPLWAAVPCPLKYLRRFQGRERGQGRRMGSGDLFPAVRTIPADDRRALQGFRRAGSSFGARRGISESLSWLVLFHAWTQHFGGDTHEDATRTRPDRTMSRCGAMTFVASLRLAYDSHD